MGGVSGVAIFFNLMLAISKSISKKILRKNTWLFEMKYKVHMLAFCKKGTVREVEVPNGALPLGVPPHLLAPSILELIFHYGQNDFQPKEICSVSVGDIVQDGDQYFEVRMAGFRALTQVEFDRIEGCRTHRGDIPL